MAELDTVVEPVIAETVQDAPETPQPEETLDGALTETGETDDSETESYTAEQVEEAAKAAAEAARAEMQAEAEKAQRQWQQQQVEENWKSFTGDFGMNMARRMVAFGAKHGNDGRTPEEAAQLFQATYLKEELDRLKNTAKPYIYKEVYDEFGNFIPAHIEKAFKDWKPTRETEEKFRAAVQTGDISRMLSGALDYLITAARESDVPKALRAEKEKSKTAAQVEKARVPGQIPQPTRGTGGPAGKVISSMNDADAAYNRGEITGPQYAEYAKRYGVSLG